MCLGSDDGGTVITGDRLRALKTLAYSENVDLQRSAALCYSEISEKSGCSCVELILGRTCLWHILAPPLPGFYYTI